MKTLSRLNQIEAWVREHAPERLIVLYDHDGQEKRGNVSDMIEDGGSFIKVVDGGSLQDLDKILEYLRDDGKHDDETKNENGG